MPRWAPSACLSARCARERARRSLPSSVSAICQCCQLPIMRGTAQGSVGRMCAQVTENNFDPALFPLPLNGMAQGLFLSRRLVIAIAIC
jgi:hypothetical protein